MGIQDRLKRDRYGINHIVMPNKDEVDRFLPKLTHRQIHKLNSQSHEVLSQYLFPSKRDKLFETNHQKIVNDFNNYIDINNSKALSRLNHQILIRKLVYFYINPQYYDNNFANYAVSWYVGGLFAMRHYTMRCMRDEKLIPNLTNFYHPSTNGYYELVKPMRYKTNLHNAYQLHDLLYPSVEEYLKVE